MLFLIFQLFLIFLLGGAIGSFLDLFISRFKKGEDFLLSRSYCEKCHHQLNFFDLIPVFSYLFLRGKCRYCKKPIPIYHFLIEVFLGFFLVFLFLKIKIDFFVFFFLDLIFLLLFIVFFYDLKYYLVPDILIYSLILITFLLNIYLYFFPQNITFLNYSFLNKLISAFSFCLFFFFIYFFSRQKWLGFGDVKFSFFIGLFLGFPNFLVSLFFASFLGSLVGLILVLFGKKKMKSELPFCPFLIFGLIFAIFFSNPIINWYLSFLR